MKHINVSVEYFNSHWLVPYCQVHCQPGISHQN